jgi:hypothetical protein
MGRKLIYRNIIIFLAISYIILIILNLSGSGNGNVAFNISRRLIFLFAFMFAFLWLEKQILFIGFLLYLVSSNILIFQDIYGANLDSSQFHSLLLNFGFVLTVGAFVCLALGLYNISGNKFFTKNMNLNWKWTVSILLFGSALMQVVLRII